MQKGAWKGKKLIMQLLQLIYSKESVVHFCELFQFIYARNNEQQLTYGLHESIVLFIGYDMLIIYSP